jgi:hypothetical protein
MVSRNNPALKPLPPMSPEDTALLYNDFLGLEYKIDHHPKIYEDRKRFLNKIVYSSMALIFVSGVSISISKIGSTANTSAMENALSVVCAVAPSGVLFISAICQYVKDMQVASILTRLQSTYEITPTVTIDPLLGKMQSDFAFCKKAARQIGGEVLCAIFRNRRFLER